MLYDMSVNESLLCNELEAGIGLHVLNCGVIEPVNQDPTMACQTSQNISIADTMSILLAASIHIDSTPACDITFGEQFLWTE
jgi:hypothetical protein